MTLNEALGGRWATHWGLWLAFLPPSILIIAVRESTTEYPAWWWPLASALLQHLAVGFIVVIGGTLLRRRWPLLPVTVFLLLWSTAGVARGLIGAGIAESVAGVPGDAAFRIASWLLLMLTWAPLIVYGLAQFERRRDLLPELESARSQLTASVARFEEAEATTSTRLAEALGASVLPVLDDLRTRLGSLRGELDRRSFEEVSASLARLHDELLRVIDTAGGGESALPSVRNRVTLLEIFDIPFGRPWAKAGLVVLLTLALTLPDAWRIYGGAAALEIIVAASSAGAVFGAVLHAGRTMRRGRAAAASSVTLAAGGAAVALCAIVLLGAGIDPVAAHGVVLLPVVSSGLLLSIVVVVAALLLARANEHDESTLRVARADVERWDAARHASIERERRRLTDLLHGPVQGRIAACVMAFNFHADSDQETLADVADQVLDHLGAASHDLATIARGFPPNGGAADSGTPA